MKKKMAFLTSLVLAALSVPVSTASAEDFAQGDVDMDGYITGHDAAIISQYADGVLKLDLTEEQLSLADVNADGVVDAADAAMFEGQQEYELCDIDGNGIVEISDALYILRTCALKVIDPEIGFGERSIRADVDCNGIVDVYDAYCILECYRKTGAQLPYFGDGKYYIIITPEIEQEFINDDTYVFRNPDANIQTLKELYALKWNINDYCDVDSDGEVSISDATAVLGIYAANAAGSDIYGASVDIGKKADVIGDGAVGIDDATIILTAYAKQAAGLL